MPVQQTIIIVKPDGMAKGLAGKILQAVESFDLKVVTSVKTHLSRRWVEQLYLLESQEAYYDEVVDWVSSAPVLLLKIEGLDAVSKVKWQIIGRYPNGIRGLYSEDGLKNVAHAPDSDEAARRELLLAEEIFAREK
jgi:nucleoside-diphosphate kinase